MSIKLNLGGVEVTCEKPEEAMVLAGAAGSLKLPKQVDLAKVLEQPIKLKLNGVEMICENPASAAATLVAAGVVPRQKYYSAEARGAQGRGPSLAWQQAKEYAEKHNITTDEARRILAKKKRELKAQALLNATIDVSPPRKKK